MVNAFDIAKKQLKKDEGFRGKPYRDTKGKLTIGYGWNIDDVPLSKSSADMILEEHITASIAECRGLFRNFDSLSDNRKAVLINMCYNLGLTKLSKFKKMIAAVEANDFDAVAYEMQNSKWYTDVKDRAERLISKMQIG